MLSAQCRDAHVDRITPILFKKYPTPKAYATTDVEEIRDDIKSINHFRKKGERIKQTCQIIIDKHDGQVPTTFVELTALPGVGPKTANAVLRRMGSDEAGFVVDVHTDRTAYRLGLTEKRNPDKTRKRLEEIVPKEKWGITGWRLILLGKGVCHARKPQCNVCPLNYICKKQGLDE
jgi:endonuclease-3